MPKLVHTLPKYRRHRASGQAIVTLAGRDFYLGPYGTTASKREYDRLVAEWLSSDRSASFGASSSEITIVELIAAYLRYAKDYYGTSETSEYHRAKLVLKRLKTLYGQAIARKFGAAEYKAIRRTMVDDGNSRTYINANMKRLVRVFRWAVGEGMIPVSLPQALGLIPSLRQGKCDARETDPVEPVEQAVIDATLPFLPEVVADMVCLQSISRMRPAKVCSIHPGAVERSGEIWVYQPSSHKTAHRGKQRLVFLGSRAQEVLLKYLARDPMMNCFRPIDLEAKRRSELHASRKAPLSCGNKPGRRKRNPQRSAGEQYTTNSYGRAISRGCELAFPWPELAGRSKRSLTGAERDRLLDWNRQQRWTPNQLRHTAATLVRREFGLEAAQIILGHTHANVTQVYAERDYAKALEVARAIG